MARDGMKLGLALLVVGTVAALTGEARAHSQAAAAHGSWVCNTYGYGGSRNQWRTVTGQHYVSRVEARDDAMRECRSKLNGCQRAGCWPDDWRGSDW
jgi:hypothetical protein